MAFLFLFVSGGVNLCVAVCLKWMCVLEMLHNCVIMPCMLCAVKTSVSETSGATCSCCLGCLHLVHGSMCVHACVWREKHLKAWCIIYVVYMSFAVVFLEVQIVSLECLLSYTFVNM